MEQSAGFGSSRRFTLGVHSEECSAYTNRALNGLDSGRSAGAWRRLFPWQKHFTGSFGSNVGRIFSKLLGGRSWLLQAELDFFARWDWWCLKSFPSFEGEGLDKGHSTLLQLLVTSVSASIVWARSSSLFLIVRSAPRVCRFRRNL